ncbi:MAG TPA: alpha-ketoglutarate-dependent dioxygenase AlkB [Microlunatus sp.]|nr:alpha-ketoglutarate-dependent dioxygenase AlkB [Microlunatus sp.]
MTLFDVERPPEPYEVVPGAIHVPDWLTLEQQRHLVTEFHGWIGGPVPIRAATVRGHPMSVQTVCLGWHWQPYRYSRAATDVNGARVLPLPDWLADLGRDALAAVDWPDPRDYHPDTALVNYYDADARMGLHQDKDELTMDPVVSISIGDACVFRFGNIESRSRPWTDVDLRSGDLFVFGGPARLAYHGVTKIIPDSAPVDCGLPAGRINITLRTTGLTD